MPLEVQGHAIPHFETEIIGKCELRGPRLGNIFNLLQCQFKNLVLLPTVCSDKHCRYFTTCKIALKIHLYMLERFIFSNKKIL